MASKRTAPITVKLSTTPGKKRKKKSANGKPIKETDRKQAAANEKKSARELAADEAKKRGASTDELNRIKGKNPGRTRKPKSKASPKGGAKIQTPKLFGKTRKRKTRKTTTKPKKSVAKSKPRKYSNNPSAVRSREYRAKKRLEQEARNLFRGTMSQAPRRTPKS